jgi:site-specific recombinase
MLIGIVNLAVSFSLALWMAMRARSVRLSSARGLGKRLWERIVLSPASFLSPAGLPRDASGAEDPPTRA